MPGVKYEAPNQGAPRRPMKVKYGIVTALALGMAFGQNTADHYCPANAILLTRNSFIC
jgi:hypothetical protein